MSLEQLRAAVMAALPEGRESRRELELIPAGEFRMRPHDGRGPFFNRDPRAVIQRSQAQGYCLVFDYDHATELAKATGAPAPASGWIHVGSTQGRWRYDRDKLYDKPRKDTWLRPLRRDWKRTLNRQDPGRHPEMPRPARRPPPWPDRTFAFPRQ